MVPLEISPMPIVPLVANGTIGNQRTLNDSRLPMVLLVPMVVPLVPMVPLVGTLVPMVPLVVPMVPLVSPTVIIINTSYLFLYSYFYAYISVFLLFSNIILLKIVLICENYKFKVKDAILDHVTFKHW